MSWLLEKSIKFFHSTERLTFIESGEARREGRYILRHPIRNKLQIQALLTDRSITPAEESNQLTTHFGLLRCRLEQIRYILLQFLSLPMHQQIQP
jgi:hypothetical protein